MRIHDFGIQSFKEVHPKQWRASNKAWNIPSLSNNGWKDLDVIYKSKVYQCTASSRKSVTLLINDVETKLKYQTNTFYVFAVGFKQKTTEEIKQELINLFPGSKLHVPKMGCQLHGDIDATLTKTDGTIITIAWNY